MVFRLKAASNLCQDSGSKWGPPAPLHVHVYFYLVCDKLTSFYNSGSPQTGISNLQGGASLPDPSLLFPKPTPQPGLSQKLLSTCS